MRVTLLLPAWARCGGPPGTLARWVARGDRLPDAQAGRSAVLREQFQFVGTTLPTAALTRRLDVPDGDTAQWLRCDPAVVLADAVTLRLVACGEVGLDDAQSQALAATLQPLFGDAGFTLEATRPDRWYLRCPRDARLPAFATPADALGDDLGAHLPQGEQAGRWRALLNEAQIALTQHPVNARRLQQGLPAVNSVWFWGAGTLPDWVKSRQRSVYSNDDVLAGLATLAGTDLHRSLDAAAIGTLLAAAGGDTQGSLAVDLAAVRDLAAVEEKILAPLDVLLSRKRVDTVSLCFESGERVDVRGAHRWRVWRRVRALDATGP